MLGYSKIENTVSYRGIDVEDALALAEKPRPEPDGIHFGGEPDTGAGDIAVIPGPASKE